MENKFTNKQIQTFELIWTAMRIMRNGEVKIIWHEGDVANVLFNQLNPDGKIDKNSQFEILLSAMFAPTSPTA